MDFPQEIIDLIIEACDIESVFTFIFVSKRYSRLFEAKSSSNYFKLPLPETLISINIENAPWVTEYTDVFKRRCLYQNKFTCIPGKYDMIKYIPFDHSKFKKSILRDQYTLISNERIILTFQNLKSIDLYYKITGRKKESVFCDVVSWHNIWEYELFCYHVDLLPVNVPSTCIYTKTFLTYERLEYLLSKKRFCVSWSYFVSLYDDLDMYKRVYQAHIENEIMPKFSLMQHVLGIKKETVKWMSSIGVKINEITHISPYHWELETVLYLYKRGILSHQTIWSLIESSTNFEVIYKQLIGKIPFPSLETLVQSCSHLKIIQAKFGLENREPNVEDMILALKYSDPKDSEFCGWLLSMGISKQKVINFIDSSNNEVEMNEYAVTWLFEESNAFLITTKVVIIEIL